MPTFCNREGAAFTTDDHHRRLEALLGDFLGLFKSELGDSYCHTVKHDILLKPDAQLRKEFGADPLGSEAKNAPRSAPSAEDVEEAMRSLAHV